MSRTGNAARARVEAVGRVPIVEDLAEEDVFEVVADDGACNALAARARAETFALENVFWVAVGVGVGEDGGGVGCGVGVDGSHEEGALWVWG